MKIFKNVAALLATLSTLTSCATIVHGTRQCVGISSNPSNATVWVDRAFAGNTPLLVEMTRKDNHLVRIELDGYQPYEAVFTREVSGWVFGNIVFGGFIGLAIDAISGGLYRLTPEQVEAEMLANQTTCSKKGQQSYITVVLEPKAGWEKVGSLTAAN